MAGVLFGDIKRQWDSSEMHGDFAVVDGDLVLDGGLESSVVISLMTDKRAEVYDELPDAKSTDRRGWWGDTLSNNEKIGSKLWLLFREKQMRQVMLRAHDYATAALNWMLQDKVAESVKVSVSNPDLYNIRIDVDITEPKTKNKSKYALNWMYHRLEE